MSEELMPGPIGWRHPDPEHQCDDSCLCFALGCQCAYCAPVVEQVDKLITDKRNPLKTRESDR